MTAPTLPRPSEIRRAADIALARLSFVHFLLFVRIEQTIVQDGEEVVAGDIRFRLWPHLLERAQAWQRGESEIILKARQLGISWLCAAYAVWVARRPGARVLLLSKGELEAFALLAKCRFIWEHLPHELQVPLDVDNDGELVFRGGGTIVALPSTKTAGRGFTATLVIADENAFHPWASENYKAYQPTVADGGQLLIPSTANGKGGFFHDQFWKAWQGQRELVRLEAEGKGETVRARVLRTRSMRGVFIPWFARPDRDEEWLEAQRIAFEGLPDEFAGEYPRTPEEAFVQLTGLVFPQFDHERHVRETEPVPWEECLYRYVAYDLGGGDPTAIMAIGCYRDTGGMLKAHVYGYYYRKMGAPTVQEMFEWIIQWHRPGEAPLTWVEADPKDETVAQSLRALGLPVRTADWARGKGLGVVAQYLEHDWITFPAGSHDLFNEFTSYRWLTRVDVNTKDRYATSTPYDHHGDLMDTLRYGLMGLYRDLMGKRGSSTAYSGVNL